MTWGLNDYWALDNPINTDDVAFHGEGATYPICTLTWVFVWGGEDGNTPPAPTTTAAVTVPAGPFILPISSVSGLPVPGGTFTVTDTSGTESASYTGIGITNATCGGAAEPCLTGVSGPTVGATIADAATLTFPTGTGGPEPELNADQRRTLYSYFTYVLSDQGQTSMKINGYAALPENIETSLRGAFQAEF